MNRIATCLTVLLLAPVLAVAASRDYPFQPVPFTDVKLTDSFWRPRIETNRIVTIPYAFEKSEETGRIENFQVAGGLSDKAWTGGFGFNDSDVSKIIEGAAYALSVEPDPELDGYLDELIRWYVAAQEEDGFLYTLWTARDTVEGFDRVACRPTQTDRWSNIQQAHQLYNLGHMYEAGVAHFLATGKRDLLDVCIKSADLVCETFHEGGLTEPPGHQEIEIGLIKLYRVTGHRKYLDQAKFFLEQRGRHEHQSEYNQTHLPVLEQDEAVGHAVRANYMYSGMADIAALTGDEQYVAAIDRIWENVVSKKLYVTGGVGASGHGEAYGDNYELPNRTAYCETCAGIANVYWNHRMFLLHGEAKYIDVMERSLYNNVLSGVSLDGKTFFYPNPLASHGSHARSPWFGCACCPSNITRFLASIGGYMYATQDEAIHVNLYGQSEADISLGRRRVKLGQRTRFPWDGQVQVVVTPDRPARFSLKLRVPGWVRTEPVPSDLYQVIPDDGKAWRLVAKVNGKETEVTFEKGYAVLAREWQPGDTVQVDWPMRVQRILCNENVEANLDRVALQRGPLVYCVEHPDVPGGAVGNLILPDAAPLTAEQDDDLLHGVTVITGEAESARWHKDGDGRKVVVEPAVFSAIPYYAWAHRGRGEMAVWLARTVEAAAPLPMPTLASRADPSTSRGDARALNDQREPSSSGDHTHPFQHFWPNKGSTEWVQYTFDPPREVSRVEVYWFDDTGRGECRLPSSWRLLHRKDGSWVEVDQPDDYGCEGDRYNRTRFTPVTTDGLRLEIQLQDGWAAGVHEWRVN